MPILGALGFGAYELTQNNSAKTDRSYELNSMGSLQNQGRSLGTSGAGTLASGTQSMQSLMNQLQKIMGGGQAGLEAVAPEVNTVASQYQGARKAAAELSPRGGGRTSTLANQPFAEMGDIQKMMFGEQSRARGQAGSLAGQMANLGLNEESLASTDFGNVANIAQNHATATSANEASMGQGIGSLLASMMMAG